MVPIIRQQEIYIVKILNLCELEKIIFYANAWLSIQLWGRGQLKDLTDDELSATIFAAKKIIESFESEINI